MKFGFWIFRLVNLTIHPRDVFELTLQIFQSVGTVICSRSGSNRHFSVKERPQITLNKVGPNLVEWSYANNKHGVSVIDEFKCEDLNSAFSCEIYTADRIKFSGSDLQSRPQVRDMQNF